MRKERIFIPFLLAAVLLGFCGFAASSSSAESNSSAIAAQIIAREKSSFDAWQRKDKAFFADFMTEDSTYFSGMSPYLETDPKVNFLPKFEQYAEMFKMMDFQMYNPRVQVYGDTAILTYNSSVTASMGGQPINYSAKVTTVYVKQGNTWRVVHSHESMNPAPKL